MNKFLKAAVAVAVAGVISPVAAHGCGGSNNCNTHNDHYYTQNHHFNNPNTANGGSATGGAAEQMQGQQQSSNSQAASNNAVNVGTGNSNVRYLNVRPVTVQASPTINPSSTVSRFSDPTCGPRMVVKREGVKGINNRIWSVKEMNVGYREYLEPDLENGPYRSVKVFDDVYQLIGHKVVDSAAVINTSTSGGFGVGGGNMSGGASVGMQSSGAVQGLVNQIQLIECVAYEVDTRPLKPRG